MMNCWRSRILAGAIFGASMGIHSMFTAHVSNTDGGMLSFHGSAALFDLFLIYMVPAFLSGQLAIDMETLCIVSIVANFVGWIAYTAYASPIYYNTFMWGLTYVQAIRLLILDEDNANACGLYMVRRYS